MATYELTIDPKFVTLTQTDDCANITHVDKIFTAITCVSVDCEREIIVLNGLDCHFDRKSIVLYGDVDYELPAAELSPALDGDYDDGTILNGLGEYDKVCDSCPALTPSQSFLDLYRHLDYELGVATGTIVPA